MMAASVNAADEEQSTFRGSTPTSSWKNMSPNNNPWVGSAQAGAVIGFSVFALSYIYVVIYIFFDINRSKKQYIELVEEDLATISQLGVSASTRAEWEAELKLRLSGKAADDKTDDQLFGAAAQLTKAEWEKEL